MSKMCDGTVFCTNTELPWLETDQDVYIKRVTEENMAKLFPQVEVEGDVDWHVIFSGKDGGWCSLCTDRDTAVECAVEHDCVIHTLH